ncbi:FecR family protein [Candidatus Gracilibacteria bacterium]|nr:FecR family protein [Candidatus Gracilibacteria bacterium]
MNKSIKGFSIVEIITTTAIIAVIAIIGFTFSSNYRSNQYNTSRVADLTAIYNLLQTNYTQNKTYPDPSGNKQYYDKNGTYAHGIDGAFGVSGFLTQKTLSRDKMGYPFMDGQTKNYYAYGKRLDGNSGYNLATVLNEKGEYFSYVVGDIGGNRMELAGLVKEYSGPNFVTSKSKYLPYNPFELKLTGKISVYSGTVGTVSIIDNNGNTITQNILDQEIEKGNTVKVGAGGLATINLSDGTELKLGSSSQDSILNFSDLEYKDNSNLLTKVMLNLSLGEIWVKAPQLDTDSSLEVTNSFAAASVRGTVFGMTTNPTSGIISLIQGKIEVGKITSKTDENVETIPLFTEANASKGLFYENGISYLEVKDSTKPVDFNYTTSIPTDMGTGKILDVETPQLKFNSGIIPNVTSIIRTSGKLNVKVDNFGADYIEIVGTLFGEQKDFTGITISPTFTNISISNISWLNGSTNYAVKLCKTINDGKKACTGEFIQRTSGQTIDETTINNYKKNASNFNASCEKGKKLFKNYGCLEDKLVAYAPYNESGDMYMNTDDGDMLGFETIMVVSKNTISGPFTKLQDTQALKTSLLPKIGGLSYTPYFNLDSSIFVSSSSDTSNITTNFITPLGLVNYNSGTSFMSYPAGNGGIFLDNDGVEYIRYNLKDLNLKDKFTVEMSIRGGALKRSSLGKNFTLFDFSGSLNTGSNKLVLNTTSSVYGNKLQLFINGVEKNIPISEFNSVDLNKLYKIIASFDGDKFSLKAVGDGFEKIATGRDSTLLNKDFIYVGSSVIGKEQWNDIIDYVKIYRN